MWRDRPTNGINKLTGINREYITDRIYVRHKCHIRTIKPTSLWIGRNRYSRGFSQNL